MKEVRVDVVAGWGISHQGTVGLIDLAEDFRERAESSEWIYFPSGFSAHQRKECAPADL